MKPAHRALRALLLLLAGALATLAWLSRHSFQKEPVIVVTTMPPEYLEDPALLLRKWLVAGGLKAHGGGGPIEERALPPGGTLFLVTLALPLSSLEVETLLTWAAGGGHLIASGSAAPFNDERGVRALHERLGVQMLLRGQASPFLLGEEQSMQKVLLEPGPVAYRVHRYTGWHLQADRPEQWPLRQGGALGWVLLSRPWGKGRITLTPDLDFLCEDHLTELDHAAYTQRLMELQASTGPVLVWSRLVAQSLLDWLWLKARPAILAGLVLLATWLWTGFRRFGPQLPPEPVQRRSIMEHIIASGRLLWQNGGEEHLLRCTRDALIATACRRNPAFPHLRPQDQVRWLADAAGGPPEGIADALAFRPDRPREYFAQSLVTLEQLRQRLEKEPP